MVTVLDSICQVWDLQQGGITLGCDGISTLRQDLDIATTIIKTQQIFDSLNRIQGYIRTSPLAFTPKHVKGHQDELINLVFLDKWVLLNVEMDKQAKGWWALCKPSASYFQYETPKGTWKI